MRAHVENGGLTVHAVAGNHAVFLGFNLTDEARRLGVTAFLSKPFDLEDVARMAHSLTAGRSEGPRQGA